MNHVDIEKALWGFCKRQTCALLTYGDVERYDSYKALVRHRLGRSGAACSLDIGRVIGIANADWITLKNEVLGVPEDQNYHNVLSYKYTNVAAIRIVPGPEGAIPREAIPFQAGWIYRVLSPALALSKNPGHAKILLFKPEQNLRVASINADYLHNGVVECTSEDERNSRLSRLRVSGWNKAWGLSDNLSTWVEMFKVSGIRWPVEMVDSDKIEISYVLAKACAVVVSVSPTGEVSATKVDMGLPVVELLRRQCPKFGEPRKIFSLLMPDLGLPNYPSRYRVSNVPPPFKADSQKNIDSWMRATLLNLGHVKDPVSESRLTATSTPYGGIRLSSSATTYKGLVDSLP